jgi:hypothetical protein
VSAAVIQPHLTVCAPGAERRELTTEFFDKGNHHKVTLPVSAEFDGQEFSSPRIDFSDYSRMSTQQHKQSGERRLPTPKWALKPDLLRKVLVHYVERRANIVHKPQPGTESERLQRASQRNADRCQRKEAILKNLCAEFVEVNKSGANPMRAKKLGEQIKNLDTCLQIDRNVAGTVLRVVHLYYSVGLDSVGVGTELGLKPPHVRALLWKLNWCWDKLRGKAKPRSHHNVMDEITRMAKRGIAYPTIASKVGLTTGQIYWRLKKSGRWKPRYAVNNPTMPRASHQKGRLPYLEHQHFSADRAVGLFLAGKSVPEIALAFGYAPRTGNNRVRTALVKASVYKPAATSLM